MTASFTESVVEDASLAWLEAAGWRIAHGPEIAPDTPATERTDYGEVVLTRWLFDGLLPMRVSCDVCVQHVGGQFKRVDP